MCFGSAVLYEGTKDGLNYYNMVSCYNWDADATPCPGPNFATQNMNYENTDRLSYHKEFSCSVNDDDNDAVVVVADPTETTDSINDDSAAATSGSAAETAPTGTASKSGGNHRSSSLLLITIVTWLFLMTLSTNNIV